jgi:hypothetical protein
MCLSRNAMNDVPLTSDVKEEALYSYGYADMRTVTVTVIVYA